MPSQDLTSASVEQEQLSSDVDLGLRLKELVGPIGEELLRELRHVPLEEKRQQLVERLRAFGVAEEKLRGLG